MKKIDRSEILDLGPYEQVRDRFRRRIIELKKHRRVAVGDRVSLVFENHDTMLFQVQEMLRAERMTAERGIADEIALYNGLLPDPAELSATLFVEITDKDRIREDLHGLVGIDEHVALVLGGARIAARFEPGRSTEEKLSSVQYVRFSVPEPARRALGDDSQPAAIEVDHPRYRHRVELSPETRRSLLEDLEE